MAHWTGIRRRLAALAGALLALMLMAALAEEAPRQALFIDYTAQPAMMVAPGTSA